MKNILKFLSLLLFFSFFLSNTNKLKAENNTFQIGAILPLSGSAASLGEYVKNGIELAYSELPKHKRERIKISFQDDQLLAAKSVSAFHKLKAKNGIKAVLVLGSGIGNAVCPLAEQAEILCVAIGASDGGIAKGKTFSFTHWVTPETEAETLVKEIKRKGYKKVSWIGTEQDGSIAVKEAVLKAFSNAKHEDILVPGEDFLPGETDFKSFITKAKHKKIEALITVLFPGALSAFAKQTQQLKLDSDLVGIELFEDENEVKASDGALIGQWYINADIASDSLQKLYKERYQKLPGWGVANAFDTVNLISEALTKTEGSTTEIASFLRSLKDYTGAAGKYSASGDNRFTLPATVKIVEKDGFSVLKNSE